MRLKLSDLSFLPLVVASAAVCLAVSDCPSPLAGGGPYHDRVYADSFGNLVIHSGSGYKRIVIGKGHLARELADYEQARNDVVISDDGEVVFRDCWKPAVCSRAAATCTAWRTANCRTCPAAATRNNAQHPARP